MNTYNCTREIAYKITKFHKYCKSRNYIFFFAFVNTKSIIKKFIILFIINVHNE